MMPQAPDFLIPIVSTMNASLQLNDRSLQLTSSSNHLSLFPALWLYDNRREHRDEASATGGESIFVDGLKIAEDLRTNNNAAFQIFATTPVRFAFRNRDVELEAWRPIIQVDLSGVIEKIHYNNRAIAPLQIRGEAASDFYRAYVEFARMLRDPAFELRLRLNPGDVAVFDNHRILHGRTAFEGPRHLQGCYVSRDSLLSNLAVLKRGNRTR
jgi:alpha-ketoglutarate-dependent taurine dioxygenase